MLLHRTYTLWIFHNEFACRKTTAYNRSNVDENLKNLICTLKKICTKNDPQCMSIYVADTLQIYGIFPTDGKVKTCNKSRVYANFPLHKIHSVTITSKSTLRLLSHSVLAHVMGHTSGYRKIAQPAVPRRIP